MTTRSVRARYRNGMFEPLDEVHLDENQEVLLTLDADPQQPVDPEEFASAAGGWIGQFDDFDELIRDIYQARTDGSRERHDT